MTVGVIGGTGVTGIYPDATEMTVNTPYGQSMVQEIRLPAGNVYFLNRHGRNHSVPPHLVNYQGNIWALHSLGVRRIVATAAVGSLRDELKPGTLVVCDQFLDFTRNRPLTFSCADSPVIHTDMSEPYCSAIRSLLYEGAGEAGASVVDGACYVCTEGPRYETAAESRMFRLLGGDVVGMTGVPEVTLARELGMCFGLLATITNHAPGLTPHRVSHNEVEQIMREASDTVRYTLQFTLETLLTGVPCDC